MQRAWEQSVIIAVAAAAVLWVAGIVLFLGLQDREVQHLGLLLIVIAAAVSVLGVLRSWQLRMNRAFIHGYHAGFHDASGTARASSVKNCDVLELSEVKARRLSRLG